MDESLQLGVESYISLRRTIDIESTPARVDNPVAGLTYPHE
jgi:hypothetical protein